MDKSKQLIKIFIAEFRGKLENDMNSFNGFYTIEVDRSKKLGALKQNLVNLLNLEERNVGRKMYLTKAEIYLCDDDATLGDYKITDGNILLVSYELLNNRSMRSIYNQMLVKSHSMK